MSRICVKNIGLKSTEKQLKDLFGTKGEVTDVRIVRTKSGKSRQLAFIGFRTDVQAQEAIRYFNKTFIETSRVTVEEAKKIGDNELLENARSRHTKKKLEKQAKTLEKEKEKSTAAATAVGKAKAVVPAKGMKNTVTTADTTGTNKTIAMSKEKRDFMEVMKHKKDKNFWANDESLQSTEAMMDVVEEETPNEENDDESDGNEESDDDDDINDLSHRSSAKGTHRPTAKAKTATAAATATTAKGTKTAVVKSNGQGNSDMDYLRSKVRAHFSDSDTDEDKIEEEDDSGDEKMEEDEEEEEEEDIEEEGDNNKEGDDKSKDKDSDDDDEANVDDDDTGRLFVRNLIFSCAEEELRALFEPFGPLASIHLPLDIEKKGKGFGFVQYVIPEHATRARQELDGSSFQGRLLHVMPAKKAPEPPPEDALKNKDKGGGRLSTFQQKKEDERRAQVRNNNTLN